MLDDLADAGDIHDRDGLDPRAPGRQRPDLTIVTSSVAGEGVLGHLAVPGLEDVQREDDTREEDDIRQGEEPASPGEITEIRMMIHGSARPSAGVRDESRWGDQPEGERLTDPADHRGE